MSISNLLMPFFLQLAMGLDPLRTGILVAPTSVAMALLAPLTGWMSEKFAPERLCALGLAINGVALIYLSFLQPGSSAVDVAFGLGLMGIGMGIFQTPNNNLLMSAVPRNRLGVGSSVLSIVRSLGYSLGATLATAIVGHFLLVSTGATSLQHLAGGAGIVTDSLVLSAFLRGYRYALLVAAAVAFAGALISLWPAAATSEQGSLP
jgi:MFS family permease